MLTMKCCWSSSGVTAYSTLPTYTERASASSRAAMSAAVGTPEAPAAAAVAAAPAKAGAAAAAAGFACEPACKGQNETSHNIGIHPFGQMQMPCMMWHRTNADEH